MKNSLKKTVTAAALTLTLMLGLLPGAAFAAEDEEITETTEVTQTVVTEAPAENAAPAEAAPAAETVTEKAPAEAAIEKAPTEAAIEEIPAEAPAETAAAAPQAPEAPQAPTAPVAPDVTGLSAKEANALIQAYNEEVDRFNAEAEAYNAAMETYRQAVEDYNASAEAFNAQAEIHNAEAEEHNAAEDVLAAQAQAEMDEYNQKMESYNKTANAIARVDAAHTAEIARQEAALGGIGRVTRDTLSQLGTVLTEDLYADNGWSPKLVGREGDLVIYWKDLLPTADHNTIQIDAGESSGSTYKVANLHIFEDFTSFDDMYAWQDAAGADSFVQSADLIDAIIIPAAILDRLVVLEYDVVEADANDTVTANTQAALFNYNSTLLTNRYLDGYTAGAYWIHTSEYIGTASYTDHDWSNGAIIFSYENGATDRLGARDTLNVTQYQYFARYAQPTMPVKPAEYTPNRMESIQPMTLLTANATALNTLSRLDLLAIPKPAADPKPAAPTNWIPAPRPVTEPETEPETEEIVEEIVPMAAPVEEIAQPEEIAEIVAPLVVVHAAEEIAEEIVPMAAPQAGWALVNLIALLLTAAAALGMAFTVRRKEEDGEDKMSKLLGVIPAAGAAVLFVLTENLHNPMVLTDRWTVAMVAILAAELVLAALTRRKDAEKEH